MAEVLQPGRRRTISLAAHGPAHSGARGARTTALVSVAVEAAAGALLIVAAHRLDADRLRLTVGLACAALLFARLGVGAAYDAGWGALALGLLTALEVMAVAPFLDDAQDLRLAAALVGVGVLPGIAGRLPATIARGLDEGRREDLAPSLLASAVAGGVGVLVAIAAAGAVDIDDPRLERLVPYFAAAVALTAMAEVCAYHRMGAGFPGTAVALGLAAVAVQGVLLADPDLVVDDAVTATAAGAGVAVLGLLVSSLAASPRPLVLGPEDAGDGPRLVGWSLAALLVVAVAGRAAVVPPLWLDEAEIARVTDGSLRGTLDAARDAHAHPPLLDVLVWASRQLLGSGDLALRLPSLLAGVLLVPAVYVAGVHLYDRRVGLVAAAVAAVGPGFVWLSGTAQPGALAALLATLTLIAYLHATRRGRLSDWVLLGVTGAALVWTHQLGLVHVAVLHVAVAVTARGRRRAGEPREPMAAGWAVALVLTGAALAALVAWRGGLGPRDVLPPFEYATGGAPGAGRSVFGLAGAALAGLFGFHPGDVTSRMLALWPMCILATFVLMGRTWSGRGTLLIALAAAPFVTLLALQVAGAPRNPPFALAWTATAVPMLALAVGRAISGTARRWRTARAIGLAVVAVLAVAAVDQAVRIDPSARFDVDPVLDEVAAAARPGDVVVYAPDILGDLVRREAGDATVVRAEDATVEDLARAPRVVVVGAFDFVRDDPALDTTLALVSELAATRALTGEREHEEAKLWTFE
jgi:hypothetical protein